MIAVNWTLETLGDGYWSRKQKKIAVTGITLGYVNDERDFGELRVFFDKGTWDTNKDGLIYTDSLFLIQLEVKLTAMGLAGADVTYSEQGMQGSDYVSCDVKKKFLDSWLAKYKKS